MRPVVSRADLAHAFSRHEAAVRNDPTALVTPLFGTVLPDPGPEGTLDERLARALDGAARLSEVCVDVQNREGHLVFSCAAHQDGALSLANLHAALHRVDPHTLPGIVRALEIHSARVTPVVGPGYTEAIAEYWYSTDHLLDVEFPDRLERNQPLNLTENQAIRVARRLGIPHARQVRDGSPWTYFQDVPDLKDTLVRLERLLPQFPGLAPLLTMLPELRGHDLALPEPDQEEWNDMEHLPLPHTLLTVSPLDYCVVAETADEYVRHHWEGGDNAYQTVLHVKPTAASRRRLGTYLTHALRIEQLITRIVEVLADVNAELPKPPRPRQPTRKKGT